MIPSFDEEVSSIPIRQIALGDVDDRSCGE